MKKYFHKIYDKIFRQTPNIKNIQHFYNREDENSISIIVDKDDNVIIQINVQHFKDEDTNKFAEVLFMLNNGSYQKSIVEIISEMAMKDPDRALFLSNVIQKWSDYTDKYLDLGNKLKDYSLDKPCVSPLSFSKLVLQQNTQNEK